MKGAIQKYPREKAEALAQGKKFCNKCLTTKELTEFGKDKGSPDLLTFYCKKCNTEKSNNRADRIRANPVLQSNYRQMNNKKQRNCYFRKKFGIDRYKE